MGDLEGRCLWERGGGVSIRSAVCSIIRECKMCRSVGRTGLGVSGEATSLEKCRVRGQCRQAERAMGKIQFKMFEASVDACREGMQGGLGIHISFEGTADSQNWCKKLGLLARLFGVVWHVCVVILFVTMLRGEACQCGVRAWSQAVANV